jgi:hypothetical protein
MAYLTGVLWLLDGASIDGRHLPTAYANLHDQQRPVTESSAAQDAPSSSGAAQPGAATGGETHRQCAPQLRRMVCARGCTGETSDLTEAGGAMAVLAVLYGAADLALASAHSAEKPSAGGVDVVVDVAEAEVTDDSPWAKRLSSQPTKRAAEVVPKKITLKVPKDQKKSSEKKPAAESKSDKRAEMKGGAGAAPQQQGSQRAPDTKRSRAPRSRGLPLEPEPARGEVGAKASSKAAGGGESGRSPWTHTLSMLAVCP